MEAALTFFATIYTYVCDCPFMAHIFIAILIVLLVVFVAYEAIIHGNWVCSIPFLGDRYCGCPSGMVRNGATTIDDPAACVAPDPAAYCTKNYPGTLPDSNPLTDDWCYKCPSSMIRTAADLTTDTACEIPEVGGDADCGKIYDCPSDMKGCSTHNIVSGAGGGNCWACPEYMDRTTDDVDTGTACAIKMPELGGNADCGKVYNCPDGTKNCSTYNIQIGIGEGGCWSCPTGTIWKSTSIKDPDACGVTDPQKYCDSCFPGSQASGILSKNPGKCAKCPTHLSLTGEDITGSDACKVEVGEETAGCRTLHTCPSDMPGCNIQWSEIQAQCRACPHGYSQAALDGHICVEDSNPFGPTKSSKYLGSGYSNAIVSKTCIYEGPATYIGSNHSAANKLGPNHT